MAEKIKVSEAPKDFAVPPMEKETDETPSGVRKLRTVRCGICKQLGHNRRTCQIAAIAAMKNESNIFKISLRYIAGGDGSGQKGDDDMGKWLKL